MNTHAARLPSRFLAMSSQGRARARPDAHKPIGISTANATAAGYACNNSPKCLKTRAVATSAVKATANQPPRQPSTPTTHITWDHNVFNTPLSGYGRLGHGMPCPYHFGRPAGSPRPDGRRTTSPRREPACRAPTRWVVCCRTTFLHRGFCRCGRGFRGPDASAWDW